MDVAAGAHRDTNRILCIRPRDQRVTDGTKNQHGHRFWDLDYLVAERRVLRVWEKTQ